MLTFVWWQKRFVLTRKQCLLRDPCYGLSFIIFLSRIVEFDVNDIYIYIYIYIYIRTRFAEIYWYNNNKKKKTNSLFQKFCLKYLTFTLTIKLSLMDLRRLTLSLFIRKMIVFIKLIIDLLVFYLFYLKLLNIAYMMKFMNILISFYQKFNVASEKVSLRNIH